ncbi:heat shock protein HslJ [Pedobacter sp. CAN_A7]|uniref:META domain-containing protein n=1 Tax=Pedobacter sp. CAN_A7 TaxID=2787722 RepID=UPI0018CBD24F
MNKLIPLILLPVILFSCSATKQTPKVQSPIAQQTVKHFAATGNEPFWSITINFDSTMYFNTADGYKLRVPAVTGEKAADANITRYHSETSQGALTVQVFNQPCEDTMSGKMNDFSVQVALKKAGATATEVYKGCGNYHGIYQLNTIWTLQSIGGTKIDPAKYLQGGPAMEIRLNDKRVAGNAGCNRFSGSFGVDGEEVVFGPLMSTKMACENMDIEMKLLSHLSGKSMKYRIAGDTLFLGEGTNLLTFKKAVRPSLGMKPL